MAKIKAYDQLRRRDITSGPSRMDLLDAYFINRDKVLSFGGTVLEIRVRGLFSTRNPDQFFIIGSWSPDKEMEDEYPLGVLISYDVTKRRGGWCHIFKSMNLSDLLNQTGIP